MNWQILSQGNLIFIQALLEKKNTANPPSFYPDEIFYSLFETQLQPLCSLTPLETRAE